MKHVLYTALVCSIGCSQPNYQENTKKEAIPRLGISRDGSIFAEWLYTNDKTTKRRFFASEKPNILGIISLKNNLLEGRQVYFNRNSLHISSIETYTRGKHNGLSYIWRKNGTIEYIVVEKNDRPSVGQMKFYNTLGFKPMEYRMYSEYNGSAFEIGVINFDSITSRPISAIGFIRTKLEQDTLVLGDSVRAEVMVSGMPEGFSKTAIDLDSGAISGWDKDIFSNNNVVKVRCRTTARGAFVLSGEITPIRVVSGVIGKGAFATEGRDPLKFFLPYYVK
jgi:hypothetical protein